MNEVSNFSRVAKAIRLLPDFGIKLQYMGMGGDVTTGGTALAGVSEREVRGLSSFDYLSGKEGLLAGERLHFDLLRLEDAYRDLNAREYELTKHVSLLQLDPLALLRLRTTGRCTVRIPESLFDLDGPGHYFRRIKSVGLSIPCVVGPYVGVNCALTLLKSTIRRSPVLRDGEYARGGSEDDRFDDYFGSVQSVVTSSGQNDSGIFEPNLNDERYLPFENAGAESEWELRLPADPRPEPAQFDYRSISDVVLHVRYTAREGGELLCRSAMEALQATIAEATAGGMARLFSMRHEFPNEWSRFASTPEEVERAELKVELREEHYPFWSRGSLDRVERLAVVVGSARDAVPDSLDVFNAADDGGGGGAVSTLRVSPTDGDLLIGALNGVLPTPTGELSLFFEDREFEDVWLAVTWASDR